MDERARLRECIRTRYLKFGKRHEGRVRAWFDDTETADLSDVCMMCLRVESGATAVNATTDLAMEVIREELGKRGLH